MADQEVSAMAGGLNKNSYISIGVVIAVVLSALWIKEGQQVGVQTAKDAQSELASYKELQKLQQEVVVTKIDALTKLVEKGTADRFTLRDHKTFAERLRELNPTLKIPSEP